MVTGETIKKNIFLSGTVGSQNGEMGVRKTLGGLWGGKGGVMTSNAETPKVSEKLITDVRRGLGWIMRG